MYEEGKVTKFREELNGYFAVVLGSSPYHVYVEKRKYDHGECNCYMGQNDYICKHMVAVAICALMKGHPLEESDKIMIEIPTCSEVIGELSSEEIKTLKQEISAAMRHIRSYNGPSSTWFSYQDSLIKGCRLMSKIISRIPVNPKTADLLVKMLLRLDRKLAHGGVDDSDGTVGDFMEGVVEVLKKFADLEPKCLISFKQLVGIESCFSWEYPLLKYYRKK